MPWRVAFKLLGREGRAGELTLLWLALALAVAAVSGVGMFTDRVRQALNQGADQLLAADLVISADHPLPATRLSGAATRLQQAQTSQFPSMLIWKDQSQLVQVKAVSAAYPLRGRVSLQAGTTMSANRPQPGTVWIDARLPGLLGLAPGHRIQLGQSQLTVAAVIEREPDAAIDFTNLMPRVMLAEEDLPATGLIQPGSRVRYRTLLAGQPEQIAAFKAQLLPRLARGERLEDVRDARPEVKQTLDRSERFLKLSAMLTVLLAAAAISLAGRRYVNRHLDSVAILRSLGVDRATMARLLSVQLFWLWAISTLTGIGAGLLVEQGIAALLAGIASREALPAASWIPMLQAALLSAVLILSVIAPQLWRLTRVPPLRVLRRDMEPDANTRFALILGGAGLLAILVWQAGDGRLAGLVIAGLVALIAVGTAVVVAVLQGVASRRWQTSAAVRFGLKNLSRRKGLTLLQTVSLSLGLLAILLLVVVRQDLFTAWQRQVPADAPNRFVINIQPDERAAIADYLLAAGVPAPRIQPMVRARLIAVNGQPFRPEQFADERTRRLAEREFNLSWGDTQRVDNQVVAGRWLNDSQPEFSVEKEIAGKLGLKMGDRLQFDVGGNQYEAPVTSLRKVNWDSFRANFFVVGSSRLLSGQPASYITSFYLPPGKEAVSNQLVRQWPGLTVIDVGAILSEIRSMLGQALAAVEMVFGLSLLAGLLVLITATLTTQDDKRQEAAILRTLGASASQVRKALLAEAVSIGALAGLLAGSMAMLIGYIAASWLFDLPASINGYLPLLGLLSGGFLVLLASYPLLNRLVKTAPGQVLASS